MNKFTTFAMLICALVATVSCNPPVIYPEYVRGASAAVAGSSVANSPAKIISGPVHAVQPIYAGHGHGVGLSGPLGIGPLGVAPLGIAPLGIASLGIGPRRALLSPGLGSLGYGKGLVPRVIAQPVAATIINPGPIKYKAYVSPPEYSRVVLPVRAADAVAKLWVPQGKALGGHGAYGAPLSAVH